MFGVYFFGKEEKSLCYTLHTTERSNNVQLNLLPRCRCLGFSVAAPRPSAGSPPAPGHRRRPSPLLAFSVLLRPDLQPPADVLATGHSCPPLPCASPSTRPLMCQPPRRPLLLRWSVSPPAVPPCRPPPLLSASCAHAPPCLCPVSAPEPERSTPAAALRSSPIPVLLLANGRPNPKVISNLHPFHLSLCKWNLQLILCYQFHCILVEDEGILSISVAQPISNSTVWTIFHKLKQLHELKQLLVGSPE
jgi:hypothetical protein